MHHRGLPESNVRTALREATGAIHEQLHEAPPFAALARQQLDEVGYIDMLRRIAAFHFTVGSSLALTENRSKLLAQDLAALGARAPVFLTWSAPETRAARLGWTYVVEGSALGGRQIYGQLNYLFGHSTEGRRFFKGSASDRLRWQTLCGSLEAEGHTSGAVHEMVRGASDAFRLFEHALLVEVPAHA